MQLRKILTLEEFIVEQKTMEFNAKRQQVHYIDKWYPALKFIEQNPELIAYSFELINGNKKNGKRLKYEPKSKKFYYPHTKDTEEKLEGTEYKETIKSRIILSIHLSKKGLREEKLINEIQRIQKLRNIIDYKIISDKLIKLTFLKGDEEYDEFVDILPTGEIDI